MSILDTQIPIISVPTLEPSTAKTKGKMRWWIIYRQRETP